MKTDSLSIILAIRGAQMDTSISRQRAVSRSGSALLITLLMLSLITIIAVAFLGTVTWAASASKTNYENQKARAFAQLGLGMAMAQVRQALGPWDNPYQNFATNPPPYFWSISPGLITCWSYTSTTPVTNYALFSTGTTNLVNLNATISDGSYPIAGEANPPAASSAPNISVYWANVLKDPSSPVGVNNQIVGRYAFWVDDENAKININTADGTMKYQTNSLGLGSPSEVSLQALQQGGANLSTTLATNIVYLARTTGLNSPKEILRASGSTPDLFTNNVFNITSYSRSPDLNVFGQPKMSMIPVLGDAAKFTTNMLLDSMTLQPSRNIYPTPSQLPRYSVVCPINTISTAPLVWSWHPASPFPAVQNPYPLAFRGSYGDRNSGYQQTLSPNDSQQTYTYGNYPWSSGMLLATYMSGTNSAGKPVTWPALSGSSTSGFLGKYTPRQIDSIVAQIVSLGSKEISPDIPWGAESDTYTASAGTRGEYAQTVPFLFSGWLSNEWVIGMGRVPKVDGIELEFITYPRQVSNLNTPMVGMDAWMEWWLPAGYLGGKNDITIASGDGAIQMGERNDTRVLNLSDFCQNTTLTPNAGAPLPRADYVSTNYWGNQILTNDQGIDFQCNPADRVVGTPVADPDQVMAAQYHNPFSLNTNTGIYQGAGPRPDASIAYDTPFAMTAPQTASTGAAGYMDWQPGTVRCVRSYVGAGFNFLMPMQTNAGSATHPTLDISGGIQVRAEMVSGSPSDPDPTPLESIRGSDNPASLVGVNVVMTGEYWTNSATPGSSIKLRDRIMQEAIPINISMNIPTDSGDPSGISKYEFIKVADPLVNKFPGDWTAAGGATVTVSDSAPAVPPYWANAGETDASVATNNEYASTSGVSGSFHSALAVAGDADSYWLPQADVPSCYTNDIASETLIPRSARFPNIGYLQYVRTGIMPDNPNPSNPASEHGTPFRLLSYAPMTDATHQETTASGSLAYPDWAMLDLLYVPTTLAPFGGPYGYYSVNGVWQGYGNPTVLASYSTGGGSTPGRLNPNGAVIYTTNTTTPQPGVGRTVPIQALVHGLMVNQTLVSGSTSPNPGFTGGTAVDDSISESDANSIPVAIENYIRANGPLRLPGELCDVPVIAALRPNVNATRNDLIRQIIGNVTTQSDTFSVWVAGESIAKIKGNINYGVFETGDRVTASVRYHCVFERYIDPGADGVYGNSISPGLDGIYGTYDDPVDPTNHPFQPRYLYRVVSVEEVR